MDPRPWRCRGRISALASHLGRARPVVDEHRTPFELAQLALDVVEALRCRTGMPSGDLAIARRVGDDDDVPAAFARDVDHLLHGQVAVGCPPVIDT